MGERTGGQVSSDIEASLTQARAIYLVGLALVNLADQPPLEIKDGIVATAHALIDGSLIDTLADMEHCLRGQPKDPMIFLIAVPKTFFGEDAADQVICPWDSRNNPQFALCISLDVLDATTVYEDQGLTYAENLRRLQFAGIPGGSYAPDMFADH